MTNVFIVSAEKRVRKQNKRSKPKAPLRLALGKSFKAGKRATVGLARLATLIFIGRL